MLNKKQLQPPFRQQDLLPVSDFIRHCRDRGVRTNEKQLEYYEREKLLLPAVRVNHGFVEHRDIDGQTYYEYGGIGATGETWLREYKRRGLVEYPAETKFREWKTYKGARPQKSRYFTEKPLPMYETFYSKYQIFPLKRIQEGLKIVVRDEALFAQDKEWIDMSRRIRALFVKTPQALRARVRHYYRVFPLLGHISDLWKQIESEARHEYELSLANGETEKEASQIAWSAVSAQQKRKVPGRARVALKKSRLSVQQISSGRTDFAILGRNADPMRESFMHLEGLPQEPLNGCRGAYRFARECYGVVDRLGWFLEMVGQKPPSLKELVTGIDGYKLCDYCQEYFDPRREDQVTCGKDRCVDAHRNTRKRLRRSMGLLK